MQNSAALPNLSSRLSETEIKKVIPFIQQNSQQSQDQFNHIGQMSLQWKSENIDERS